MAKCYPEHKNEPLLASPGLSWPLSDGRTDGQTDLFQLPCQLSFFTQTHKRTRTNRKQTDTAGRQADRRRTNGTLHEINRASRSLLRQVYVVSIFRSFLVDLGGALGVPDVRQNWSKIGPRGAPKMLPVKK